MKKNYYFLIGCIAVCLSLCFYYFLNNESNDIMQDVPVNIVVEDETNEYELDSVPLEIIEDDLDNYDKIIKNSYNNSKLEDELERGDMKKEFEKPIVEVVEFENQDIITVSGETPEAPLP